MAFLCPVRLRSQKSKKKNALNPILLQEDSTHSTSTSTFDKKSHLVLHSFTPCVDDELEVKRGDVVTLLYKEHDWAYVVLGEKEGFIPFSYLELEAEGEVFLKDPTPTHYLTLYTFKACNENDLDVERGDLLCLLNKDDPDWYWVSRCHDKAEGFVPASFIFPFSYLKEAQFSEGKTTELVMLFDYKAQAPDDLSVKRGDWVSADLSCQTVEGWLWAWSQKGRRYGFVPKAYARVPAMTSL